MQELTLIMFLLAAVLVSAIVNQLIPRVSLPLVQIAMGLALQFFSPSYVSVTLDPEIFMVIFIAPLLYIEAKNANKAEIWHERRTVLSLAIGLVVFTTLFVGFSLNFLAPSIPLAVAFALGAALGPTDAVAVSSLSEEVAIPKRQKILLKGELLLNDASGIVAFQFAIAAATTGTFSFLGATTSFLYEFFGGIVVGVALALLSKFIIKQAQLVGVDNQTFHVLFEVFIPIIIYLAASNIFHVSGVMSVVTAGLINIIEPRSTINPSTSRMNIVSTSVWNVLAFTLNGIVFVLLGTQIPYAMISSVILYTVSASQLIIYVFGVTLALYLIRFVWVYAHEIAHIKSQKTHESIFSKEAIKRVLIMTLAGAKGTISLSIIFTLPYYISTNPPVDFPGRDLLIFIACGVILLTLLCATFIVPLIAPQPKEDLNVQKEKDLNCKIDILRAVIQELTAQTTKKNRKAMRLVIASYNKRIKNLKDKSKEIDTKEDYSELNALRHALIIKQEEYLHDLIESEEVDYYAGYKYYKELYKIDRQLKTNKDKGFFSHYLHETIRTYQRLVNRIFHHAPLIQEISKAQDYLIIREKLSAYAVNQLNELMQNPGDYSPELIGKLLIEHEKTHHEVEHALSENNFPTTQSIDISNSKHNAELLALSIEQEQIQIAYEEGRLSRAAAIAMRNNIATMITDINDGIGSL